MSDPMDGWEEEIEEDWESEEDDDYHPYEYDYYSDACEESDGYFDDDYDDYVTDWEYQQSLMSPIQRMWRDFTGWFYGTRLYKKWSNWRYYREHGFHGEDIPF